MEILQADDKLREEIIKDAKTKAERIIKKADREAKAIVNEIDSKIKEGREQHESLMRSETEEAVRLIFASIEIEAKKKIIAQTGEIIDSIYGDLASQLLDGSLISYKDIISKLIIRASEKIGAESYIIETNEKELVKFPEKDLLGLSLSGGKITTVNAINIHEGFMLYSGDRKKTSHISVHNFVTALKKDTRTKIYEILTKGK